MEIIKDLTLDEERALYNHKNVKLLNIKFDGPKDGESAIKECENIHIENCYFNLRYPIWHVNRCKMRNIEMTINCRAAIWYSNDIQINNSKLFGIKALRECFNIEIENTQIESYEFGWKSNNINLKDVSIKGEYLFFDSNNIALENVKLTGKYSFQYVKELNIVDSDLDTKDAFWHSKNVTVKNSVLKGEYLGWYSENLTLIDCEIIGTQPLCYCKNLKLINCTTKKCDLAFENSEVNGNIIGYIDSIKNVLSGTVTVDNVGNIIKDDEKYGCSGQIIIKNKEN